MALAQSTVPVHAQTWTSTSTAICGINGGSFCQMSQITQPDPIEEWATEEFNSGHMSQVTQPYAEDGSPVFSAWGDGVASLTLTAQMATIWGRAPDGIIYMHSDFAKFYGQRDCAAVWDHSLRQSGLWNGTLPVVIQRILKDPPAQMLPPLGSGRCASPTFAALEAELQQRLPWEIWDRMLELVVLKCYPWGAGHAIQRICNYPSTVMNDLRRWAGMSDLGMEVVQIGQGSECAWSIYIRNTGYSED